MGDGWDQAFRDLDVSRTTYLLVYLFLLIMGMGGMASTVRRRPKPPRCTGCQTPVGPDTASGGPWGGWTCGACGAPVDPPEETAPRTGARGWMDQHPWAVHGAVWGLVIWGLLAGRDLYLHEPTPDIVTLPLTVVGGLGVGWLLTLMHARRG